MIGYLCKYTPIQILESFEEQVYKLNPNVSSFNNANSITHSNMCSFSKAIIEECYKNNIDKLILVNCCDSIRRLYDVLKFENKFKFIYLIDLPRKTSNDSCTIFYNEILKLILNLENAFNKKFNFDYFYNIVNNYAKENKDFKNDMDDNSILVMGARIEKFLLNEIQNLNYKIHDLTCTEFNLNFNDCINSSKEDFLMNYSSSILNQFPCMRMSNIKDRYDFIDKNKDKIKGIIYHTVKFCDYYAFDYKNLKLQSYDIPILKIETDFLNQNNGQIITRLQAFIESLSKKSNLKIQNKDQNAKNNEAKYFIGIDSGSTSTNTVIIDSNNNIISYSVVRTGAKSLQGANSSLNEALKKSNLKKDDISYIIATGYGRYNIPFSNESITEITCHAKGVFHLNQDVRTIIDIGGQDSKVIKLNDDGGVKEFVMNDKCAAGTGRFIENMCKILEIPIENIGNEYSKWTKDLTITSMCTVFAESEVVSLIAQNNETSDIIHGICKSVSNRVFSLAKRIGINEKIMITGGAAKNYGIVDCLENLIKTHIFVPKEPQIIGALGAALFAKEHFYNTTSKAPIK